MRLERMEFWFPLSNLEDVALSRAVNAIFEARGGGLLGDSVATLVQNFETAGPGRGETWYYKLQGRVRKAWRNVFIRTNYTNSDPSPILALRTGLLT